MSLAMTADRAGDVDRDFVAMMTGYLKALQSWIRLHQRTFARIPTGQDGQNDQSARVTVT